MDRYRNLFKQNALTTTRSRKNNVQEFLRGRRNRRSEVMDIQRRIEPEDIVIPLAEEKLPTSASKKQQRPFVVGKVRHKAHSPPFLHQPVSSEDTRKITPLKSFAPINYQFRKRFLINSPSPTRFENHRSPYSKKTSNSKKKNLKSAKHDADHITVRLHKKPTHADLQSSDSLNTPVFGRDNCEDIHGNARKQLWPDPSEEVIFGRSNVARALKLKDSTPRSPQGTFKIDSRPVFSPPDKENIISSSLMFHKNLEKVVQNMDSDCSEDFDASEHDGNHKSQSLSGEEDIMISEPNVSSHDHQVYKIDNPELINQSTRITTRSSYRLSRNRSGYEENSLKSSELSREDAASSDKSLKNSISKNTGDIRYSIGQSLLHDENNESASLNSIEADIFNKALTDSLEISICDEEKSEDAIAEPSSEKSNVLQVREKNSSSSLSSPISLECREELGDSPTDHSHQSLNNKNSKNEDENSSVEKGDVLFLRPPTPSDCTEEQTDDAFGKYEKAVGNDYEALSDVSSPTLLVRNLADLDDSLTMQIFPQTKFQRTESSKACATSGEDCNATVERKDSMSPNRLVQGPLDNILGEGKISAAQIFSPRNKSKSPESTEKSKTNDSSSSSSTSVSADKNSPFLSSSLITTNLERVSKSSSSEEYASLQKSEEVADAQISGDASNISSCSINESNCKERTSETRGRVSQNYYGVSRISVYVDSPPNEKRRSNTVEKNRESRQRLTQDSDLSIPSQLFLEKTDDGIQNRKVSSLEGKEVSRESAGGSSFTRLFTSPSSDVQTQTNTKCDELDDTKAMSSECSNGSIESIAEHAENLPKHPDRNTFSCAEATLEKVNRICYSDGFEHSLGHSSTVATQELQNKHELFKPRKSLRLSQAISEKSEDISLRESFFRSPRAAPASREMTEDVPIPKNAFTSPRSSLQGNELLSVNQSLPKNISTVAKDVETSSEDEIVENSSSSPCCSASGQESDAGELEIHGNNDDYSSNTDSTNIFIAQTKKETRNPILSESVEVAVEKDLESMDGSASHVSPSSQSQSSRSSINKIRLTRGEDWNKSNNESLAESSYHLAELMASQELEESVKNTSKIQRGDGNASYTERKSLAAAMKPFEENIGEVVEGKGALDEYFSRNSAYSSRLRNSVKEKSFSNTDSSYGLQNESLENSKREVRRSNSIDTHETYVLSTSRTAEEIANVTKRRGKSSIKVLNDSVDQIQTRIPFDPQDAEVSESLVVDKCHEDFDENPVIEKEKSTDATQTPKDLENIDYRVRKLRDLDINKENVEPNSTTLQNSPYKLRIRTPKNQMSPAIVLSVSNPLMAQDTATKDEDNTGVIEKVSNASPEISQENRRYLEVVTNINSNILKDDANGQTSPYSLRIRTPKSQKKEAPSRVRTPLKSRENVKKSPGVKEQQVESEVENVPDQVKLVKAEKNTRRKGRLGKETSENEMNIENSAHKSKARTPRNQKIAKIPESEDFKESRERSNINSETEDPEIEPIVESKKTKRGRAEKASSKNVVQDELGVQSSPYKLRARTPKNKKDQALTLNLTPMKSSDEPGQSAETEQNQNQENPRTLTGPAVENRAGKKRRKAVTPLKPQDEQDQKAEPESSQGKEGPKTPNEPDANDEGQKRRRGVKNVSKNLVVDDASVQESQYKLRNRSPRTQKNKVPLGTPSKSQERVECHPDVEVEVIKETFQTPNEPELKSLEKKRGRKGVKNIIEVLTVDDTPDEGSRYKLRSRTPKSQANVIPVETKKSSTKRTPRQKKTRPAVARALPMDLPGLVIDLENSPSVEGTNGNSKPPTPKSPIVVPFRKENPQVSGKPQEVEALDLSTDDEDLDYRVFLSRVVAKRGLDVALSPMTPVSNARQDKTPAIRPGLCITSETPKTPVTVIPAPTDESPLSSMASPLRVLSLRNRGISVSPSPKKRTPRK